MKHIEERGREAAARGVGAALGQIAAAARDEAPGDVAVTVEGSGVVLSGRRLAARAMHDARLRGIGWLAARRAR